MQITIFTDASFDPELKIGAWACQVNRNGLVDTYSGFIPSCNNSTEAERIGVANALLTADVIAELKKCKVILYCDNKAAMRPVKLSNKTGQKKQRGKNQLLFYQKYIEPYLNKCLDYDIKHVKGHTKRKNSTQYIIQDWCDTEAKRLLVEYKSTIALSE